MTNQLIISNTLIPVDHYNRVNLNALHKASGLKINNGGKLSGTFAHELLAI